MHRCERHVGPPMLRPTDEYEPCGAPAVYLVHDRETPWPVCADHVPAVDQDALERIEP